MTIVTRLTLAAVALLSLAAPAMAQNFTSYEMGGYRYHNGTDSNGGSWNGTSYRMGDHTYTNWSGPNGQTRSCSSYQMGGYTYTNC